MARMVVTAPEYTKAKYNLPMLKEIDEYVASVVEVNIPVSTYLEALYCTFYEEKANVFILKFSNPITGFCAFTHKAGIHAKGRHRMGILLLSLY